MAAQHEIREREVIWFPGNKRRESLGARAKQEAEEEEEAWDHLVWTDCKTSAWGGEERDNKRSVREERVEESRWNWRKGCEEDSSGIRCFVSTWALFLMRCIWCKRFLQTRAREKTKSTFPTETLTMVENEESQKRNCILFDCLHKKMTLNDKRTIKMIFNGEKCQISRSERLKTAFWKNICAKMNIQIFCFHMKTFNEMHLVHGVSADSCTGKDESNFSHGN